MAVSPLLGVLVSTVLTLVVIPLGCVGAGSSVTRVVGVSEYSLALDSQGTNVAVPDWPRFLTALRGEAWEMHVATRCAAGLPFSHSLLIHYRNHRE